MRCFEEKRTGRNSADLCWPDVVVVRAGLEFEAGTYIRLSLHNRLAWLNNKIQHGNNKNNRQRTNTWLI